MMYLSRIAINKQVQKARVALSFPQMMHAAVLSSFPPGEGYANEESRVLWRIDQIDGKPWLYVLSAIKPDFKHLVEQFGWQASGQDWETKDYDVFLDRLENGQKWHFRIHANPVQKHGNKVLPHVTVSQQKAWLKSRAEKNGFSILQSEVGGENYDCFDVVYKNTLKFRKTTETKTAVSLSVATFEGILVIEDVEIMRKTLCLGIGRAKAYGCGMLTLSSIK